MLPNKALKLSLTIMYAIDMPVEIQLDLMIVESFGATEVIEKIALRVLY